MDQPTRKRLYADLMNVQAHGQNLPNTEARLNGATYGPQQPLTPDQSAALRMKRRLAWENSPEGKAAIHRQMQGLAADAQQPRPDFWTQLPGVGPAVEDAQRQYNRLDPVMQDAVRKLVQSKFGF